MMPVKALLSLRRAREQFLQRRVEFYGNRMKNRHGGIVDTSLEPPHHIRMDARIEGERLLGQVTPLTTFPNFFTETPQDHL